MGQCFSKRVRTLCCRLSGTPRATNEDEEDPYWSTSFEFEEVIVPQFDLHLGTLLEQDSGVLELEFAPQFEAKLRESVKSEIGRAILPTVSFYLKVVGPTTDDSILTENRTQTTWQNLDSTVSLRKEPHFYCDRKGQRSAGDLLDRGDGDDELRVAKYSNSAMKKYNSAS